MSIRNGRFSVTTKLPHTGVMATSLEFAEPSGYGLGKSGWVTAVFEEGDVPAELAVASEIPVLPEDRGDPESSCAPAQHRREDQGPAALV